MEDINKMTPEELARSADAARAKLGNGGVRRLGGTFSLPAQPFQGSEVKVQQPTTIRDQIIEALLAGPEQIDHAQAAFDHAHSLYSVALTRVAFRALSEPLFPGKKGDDGQRPAGNEDERKLALDLLVSQDRELVGLALAREGALRSLQRAKNTFEAAKLIAGMLSK